jgi:hypothetical protein
LSRQVDSEQPGVSIKELREMAKQANTITGACGEHYVASYLSGFGLIVAMPRGGIPGCDLLVANETGGHAVRSQVKTGTQATRNTKEYGKIYLWSTSYKVIEKDDKHLWYAYVWLKDWPRKITFLSCFSFRPRLSSSA